MAAGLPDAPGTGPHGRPLVPDWLVQAASLGWRLLVVAAFGVVALASAAVLGTVVAAVVLAAAVTFAVDPLTDRLRAGGRSPSAAAGIVTLAVGGGGLGVIAVIAIAFVPAIVGLLRSMSAGLAQVQQALESASLTPPASTMISQLTTDLTDWVSAAAGATVAAIASTATILILAFFLLFFLVSDLDRAIAWMLQAAAGWQRDAITRGTTTARRRVGRSLRETAMRSLVMGAVALIVAFVLGLPAPGALAVVVVLGTFIPLLGPVATTAFVGLVALGSGGLAAALAAIVALVVTTLVLPRLPGSHRWRGHGVHPAVVLVALTMGAIVGGPLGMVLGVPVVMVLADIGPAVIAALNGQPEADDGAGIVPRWLDRLAQWSARLLVLVGVVAVALEALGQIPLLVVPVIVAAVAAATMAPGVSALLRRGVTPTAAALSMTIGGFGAILVILVLTVAALAGPINEIVANAATGGGRIDSLLGSDVGVASIVAAIGPDIARAVATVVAALGVLAIVIVLGAILTFYLLRDGGRGFEAVSRGLARWRHDELEVVAERSTDVLGGYMIGTGVVSAVGAASQFILMTILGIPLAWPLAVLGFFGGYIPYIGTFITTGIAFLVTVALGSTQDVVIMFLFTITMNIVQGNIVAPLVYGKAVNIHPAVVLLAIPAGSAIAGIAGMFLAVPVIGIIATSWRTVLRVFGREPVDVTEPAPEPIEADTTPVAGASPRPTEAAGT